MIRVLIALLASLSLAACQPSLEPVASAPVASAGCGIAAGTVIDQKALYGAEATYNVAADAYLKLSASGVLVGSPKARARGLLIQSYEGLKVARTAIELGQVCTFNDAIANVKLLAIQAKTIVDASKK